MDGFLTNRSNDAPSGENLEYEPVFAALELAAQPGEEKQAGEEIIQGDPPEYRDVITKALAVLEQSHDLRAGLHLAVAEVHVNGFPGLARATGYIHGCLEQFWDTCHPQLDEEDDDDPTMRVNAVLGLADDATMVRAVRNAALTRSNAFGMVSLRDIEVARGETEARAGQEKVPDEAAIAAAFQDTDDAVLQEIFEGAKAALENVKSIDATFNDKIPGQGPDLSPIMRVLQRAVKALGDATGADTESVAAPEGVADTPAPSGGGAAPVPGAINGPRDVEAALDRIMAYYATKEPSSPVPTLLARAKRLIGADFVTIMKDIAPDGMSQVRNVGGLPDE
ncbi:MAG: type VI secretion system protein TssA [Sulfitobacter sp.]